MSDLRHQHEWRREPASVEHDDHVYVTYECTWVEVLSATTSERYDETFYEHGAECAATKTVTWRPTFYHMMDGDEKKVDLSAVPEKVWNLAFDKHRDAMYEAASVVDPDDPPVSAGGILVGENDEWYVELQRTDVSVREDWK